MSFPVKQPHRKSRPDEMVLFWSNVVGDAMAWPGSGRRLPAPEPA